MSNDLFSSFWKGDYYLKRDHESHVWHLEGTGVKRRVYPTEIGLVQSAFPSNLVEEEMMDAGNVNFSDAFATPFRLEDDNLVYHELPLPDDPKPEYMVSNTSRRLADSVYSDGVRRSNAGQDLEKERTHDMFEDLKAKQKKLEKVGVKDKDKDEDGNDKWRPRPGVDPLYVAELDGEIKQLTGALYPAPVEDKIVSAMEKFMDKLNNLAEARPGSKEIEAGAGAKVEDGDKVRDGGEVALAEMNADEIKEVETLDNVARVLKGQPLNPGFQFEKDSLTEDNINTVLAKLSDADKNKFKGYGIVGDDGKIKKEVFSDKFGSFKQEKVQGFFNGYINYYNIYGSYPDEVVINHITPKIKNKGSQSAVRDSLTKGVKISPGGVKTWKEKHPNIPFSDYVSNPTYKVLKKYKTPKKTPAKTPASVDSFKSMVSEGAESRKGEASDIDGGVARVLFETDEEKSVPPTSGTPSPKSKVKEDVSSPLLSAIKSDKLQYKLDKKKRTAINPRYNLLTNLSIASANIGSNKFNDNDLEYVEGKLTELGELDLREWVDKDEPSSDRVEYVRTVSEKMRDAMKALHENKTYVEQSPPLVKLYLQTYAISEYLKPLTDKQLNELIAEDRSLTATRNLVDKLMIDEVRVDDLIKRFS